LTASDVDQFTTTMTTTIDDGRLRLYDDQIQQVKAMRQARVAKQSQTHTQEMIMAFAAGGASLFLAMAAMRSCGSRQSSRSEEGIQMAAAHQHSASVSSRSSEAPLMGGDGLLE